MLTVIRRRRTAVSTAVDIGPNELPCANSESYDILLSDSSGYRRMTIDIRHFLYVNPSQVSEINMKIRTVVNNKPQSSLNRGE